MSPQTEADHHRGYGYDAFSPEYKRDVNPQALEKDLLSYFAEYRMGVQKWQYELNYIRFPDKSMHLADIDTHEAMITKAQRAIDKRLRKGKDPSREIAEKKGLESIENQLQHAEFGDQIVWISPPGLKTEGYGDYAFIFVGTVDKVNQFTKDKHLLMTALRVDYPRITQFNALLSFLTGKQFNLTKAEQFLAMPQMVPYMNRNILEDILNILELKESEKDHIFKTLTPILLSSIKEFIKYVKQGKSQEFLFNALQSMELFILDFIKEYKSHPQKNFSIKSHTDSLPMIMQYYKDQRPPAVAGSCGSANNSSSESSTSNIFNKYSSLNKLFNSDEEKNYFNCPDCGHEIPSGKGITTCPELWIDERPTSCTNRSVLWIENKK